MSSTRILGFDFLRGILAVGVMVYHYLAWSKTAHLYNLGTYGVYAFFVLSGASMYVAYNGRMNQLHDLVPYLVNRIFRIFPLLLAVGLAIPLVNWLAVSIKTGSVSVHIPLSVVLGVSPTFGFTQPAAVGIATGAWSLGIEFVFYAIFPLLLAVFRAGWKAALICSLVFLIVQVSFVNMVLADGSLVENWVEYTQFGAFGFYFAFGMLLGKFLHRRELRPHRLAPALFVLFLLAVAVSSGQASTDTLLGAMGVAMLCLVCLAVAASAYLPLGGAMRHVAHWLGALSYPIYLLHPVAWRLVGRHDGLGMMAAAAITIMLSWLSWKLLEQPAIHLGKHWNLRLASPLQSGPT